MHVEFINHARGFGVVVFGEAVFLVLTLRYVRDFWDRLTARR